MRTEPSILHLDLDAFFASVEQRDKPSLRGKPVVVGGVGGRGVVATASYEARAFGIHSAMPTSQARRLCPNAAFLSGRFAAYAETSRVVMEVLREITPLVEPLSLDEAYLDLAAGPTRSLTISAVTELGRELKSRVYDATGGLKASIGIGSSKLIAKIASDLDKPDGLVVVAPGTEQSLIRPMPIRVLPGVGPATAHRLLQVGVHTVADAEQLTEAELVHLLGKAHGSTLHQAVRCQDARAVIPERETKSISVEDTYETDHHDPGQLLSRLDHQAEQVATRLTKNQLSGRTISIKVRFADFSTVSRSQTLAGPVDDAESIAAVARQLFGALDTRLGVRLLGVGISGLSDWIQEPLFSVTDSDPESPSRSVTIEPLTGSARVAPKRWPPGADVIHDDHGPGWVWGSGLGVVTIRFESASSSPGPVRSFSASDPALHLATPPTWAP